MKSSVVFIFFLVCSVPFYLLWRKKHMSEDNKFVMFLVFFMAFFFMGGWIAFSFSPTVTVVNGTTKDEVKKENYVLFYSAEPQYGKTQTVMMVPRKHVIVNRTDQILTFIPIDYVRGVSKDGAKDGAKYSPIDIPAHSVVKVPDEPCFFYGTPPKYVRTKHSSRVVKGLIQIKQ